MRARTLGLVPSHMSDMIFTNELAFAGQQLFDEDNRGRFLALFRHPVDRAISLFHRLQASGNAKYTDMSVLEWTNLKSSESNYMVHNLRGLPNDREIDNIDLILAKELIRQRFVVGLRDEIAESFRRFDIVLGVDKKNDVDKAEKSKECLAELGGGLDVTPKVSYI